MTRETLEELRERLLRQHNVRQMIQVRAYEIYLMRGSQPGGEAQDWFHAEHEVLAFLLADESTREDEQSAVTSEAAPAPSAPAAAPTLKKAVKRTSGKPADGKATAPKAPAKRAAPKKAEPKSKSPRTSKKPKTEEQRP